MSVSQVELSVLDVFTIRMALECLLVRARRDRRSMRSGSALHREASESIVMLESLLAKLPEASMCEAAVRQALAEGYEAATATRN